MKNDIFESITNHFIMTIEEFALRIPKAELHLHIEGTFEPELMFALAQKNKCSLPYETIDAVKAAYHFSNLQDFLDIYYAGAAALIEEEDFFALTMAYLDKVAAQQVKHVEIFFDPQTHTERGIAFSTVFKGIKNALDAGQEKYGISYRIILCFLRHLDEAAAMQTLEEALPYKEFITGVGLDSSERGFPPSLFERVFARAREEGFIPVAHAGEEGPAAYIWEALNLLQVARIDHGNNCLEDEALVAHLVENQIPLTVCPLSNLYLKVVKDLTQHPLKRMMEKGLMVTVNSDDPAYFGGYLNENYLAMIRSLSLTKQDIYLLAQNSFKASFLSKEEKDLYLKTLEEFYALHGQ